jgi:hypothetical protein
LLLCIGCTPIRPVAELTARPDAGGAAGTAAHGGAVSDAAQPSAAIVAKGGDACPSEGARSCSGHATQTPLLCKSSVWQPEPPCADDERCDTAADANQGLCRPIAMECTGHEPGVPFCDADVQRVCADLVSSQIVPCGDHHHCVASDAEVTCACVPGFIDQGSGCHLATDCRDQGGCDPLTRCEMSGGQRVCTACPDGYTGTGDKGCAPLLLSLVPSPGQLSPEFSPTVFEYHITLPISAQSVTLSASAPAAARVEFGGSIVKPGSAWSSGLLKLGDNTVKLTVTSQFGVSSTYDLTITRTSQQVAYIKASNSEAGDQFGISLALDGDTLVVGALYEDSGSGGVNGDQASNAAADSGAAYVFVNKAGSWVQQAYLKGGDSPSESDFFGTGVAISGDTIVVGAMRGNLFNPLDVSNRNGTAYVFVRNGEVWSQQAQLTAKDAAPADIFGFSVAIQKDTVVIGAPEESSVASQSGAAYIFTRSGTSWMQTGKVKAKTPVEASLFGCAVALDKDTLVVGAQHDPTVAPHGGSASVFVRQGSTWTEQQHLSATKPSAQGSFGYSVALRGDTIAVGSPRADIVASPSGEVYVFDRVGQAWTLSATLAATVPRESDFFGSRVALSDSALLIGANGDASGARGVGGDPTRTDGVNSGAAYLYARQGKMWIPSAYIKSANSDPGDDFGYYVALSDQMVVISALYEDSGANGSDGDPADNSASTSGAIYVYR